MVEINLHSEAPVATPTQTLVANAQKSYTITDTNGRSILLREPPTLAQYELIGFLGNTLASNITYVQMVLPLLYVAAIDGETLPSLSSKRQLDALIQRLGDAQLRPDGQDLSDDQPC